MCHEMAIKALGKILKMTAVPPGGCKKNIYIWRLPIHMTPYMLFQMIHTSKKFGTYNTWCIFITSQSFRMVIANMFNTVSANSSKNLMKYITWQPFIYWIK